MAIYKIELDYGADLLQVCAYDESEDKEEVLERVADGDYDIIEDQTFMTEVNDVRVDDESIEGWKEEFETLEIPSEGLYITGGTTSGTSYLSLELPDDEEFDPSKMIVKGFTEIAYQLDKDHEIKAQWEDEDENDLEDGNTFYFNGEELELDE